MLFRFAIVFGLCLIICCRSGAATLSVRDFGALGDGSSDDTAAFQKALNEAGKTPGTRVSVPVGNYLIRGSLFVPPGVSLEGVWQAPTAFTQNFGSTLLATGGAGDEDAAPLITMAHNSCLKGLTIFYPEQTLTEAPPTPYPWTIRAGPGDNITVEDILAVNPYKLLDLTGADRHLVRGIYGQPLRLGIRVDAIYDLGRIENCHLWPFFTRWWDQSRKLHEWMMEHAVAFDFARAEWQYVHNTFCFGYSVGYRFTRSETGSSNGNFSGIGADCCRRPVLVEDVEPAGDCSSPMRSWWEPGSTGTAWASRSVRGRGARSASRTAASGGRWTAASGCAPATRTSPPPLWTSSRSMSAPHRARPCRRTPAASSSTEAPSGTAASMCRWGGMSGPPS